MFRNYLIIAWRNFRKHKVFSIINISGLAIGISAALVIFMLVSYEFSFDKFEKDRDRIYRVVSDLHFPDQLIQIPGVSVPLGPTAKREIPGLDAAASFYLYPGSVHITVAGENKPVVYKKQTDIILADQEYFNIVPYQWIAGSAAVLQEPFIVVLTESRAKTYFSFADISQAVGKTITYYDSIPVRVAGIVKDIDKATDFIFKEFISRSTVEKTGLKNDFQIDDWNSISSNTQLLLKAAPGKDTTYLNKQLKELYARYAKKDFLSITNTLQPVSELHFNADYGNFGSRQASKPTLYGLITLGAFLLLLGCINFINLMTAQAGQRAKEIGIRKTMGSSRRQLIVQFLSETLLLTIAGTGLAFFCVPILLKIFSGFIPPEINTGMLGQPQLILFSIGLIIVVSILAGLYPSMLLSGYNPSLVLKNQASANIGKTRKGWLRKTLTVSQFVIAQFLVIASIVVVKQINYSINKDLGFKKDAIITFDLHTPTPDQRRFVLQHKLQAIPGIERISLAGSTPAVKGYSIGTMKFAGTKKEIETTVEIKYADTNYFKLYGMKLLAGRYLQQSDTTKEFVINETFAAFLGFTNPSDIIGKMLDRGNGPMQIVGVLADFNSQSTRNKIKPLAYSCEEKTHASFHIALQTIHGGTASWKQTIANIEKAYKAVYPEDDSFSYEFFDERISRFYTAEQNLAKLFRWATGLAIFISCLGLFGLVIYTTSVRKKEIGVRKVLGASVTRIVSLLSKDFMGLVLLAFIIAAPLAGWVMYKWLQDFAYRTTISGWVFLASGGAMILLALITLSIQTIRSAMANPVKSLRTE